MSINTKFDTTLVLPIPKHTTMYTRIHGATQDVQYHVTRAYQHEKLLPHYGRWHNGTSVRLVGDTLQGRHVALASLWLNGAIITYLKTWTYHQVCINTNFDITLVSMSWNKQHGKSINTLPVQYQHVKMLPHYGRWHKGAAVCLVGDRLQGRHVAVTSLWLDWSIISFLRTWTYHQT